MHACLQYLFNGLHFVSQWSDKFWFVHLIGLQLFYFMHWDCSHIIYFRIVVNVWADSSPHYRKVDTCVEYGVGMHVLAWVSGPM